MKSLLISRTYFPPATGGIARFMGAVAASLGSDQVACLTGVPGNLDTGEEGRHDGVRVYRRPWAFRGGRYWGNLKLLTVLAEVLTRERPAMLQVATVDEGYVALRAQQVRRLPFVIYAHGNDVLGATRGTWDKPRQALRRAAAVLANSRYTAGLVARAGVPAERIEILHPGCDVARFRPQPAPVEWRERILGPRARGRVLLTVGGLFGRKGQDTVIRALPLIAEAAPDVCYVIVGDGPRRKELERLTRDCGVGDRVVFWGLADDEDVVRFYALCDVFVMPSRNDEDACDVEGFGMVFLEAGACRRPVVGPLGGGVPDAVLDGETGLLVPEGDPAAVARATTQLLTDPALAARFGAAAYERVRQEFTWARVGSRLEALLARVASR